MCNQKGVWSPDPPMIPLSAVMRSWADAGDEKVAMMEVIIKSARSHLLTSRELIFIYFCASVFVSMRKCRRLPIRRSVIMKIGRDTSELQSRGHLVCRLLLEKKK